MIDCLVFYASTPHPAFNFSPVKQLRTLYYIWMSVVQDNTDAQRRGIIAIHTFSDNLTTKRASAPQGDDRPTLVKHRNSSDYRQMRRKVLQLRNSLPIKVNAVHLCTDDPNTKLFFQILLPLFNMRTLTRVRIQYGKHSVWHLLVLCSPICV